MDQNTPHHGDDQEPGRAGVPMMHDQERRALQPAVGPPMHALALPGQGPNAEEEDIDLMQYFQVLIRRRWQILAVIGIALAVTFVNTLMTPRTYRATATLQIGNDIVRVVETGSVDGQLGWRSMDEFYNTEIAIMQSRSLAERVAGDLGLYDGKAAEVFDEVSPWSRMMGTFLGSGGDAKAEPPEGEESPVLDSNSEDRALKRRAIAGMFRGGVDVDLVGESSLVRIHYDSPDPKFSVRAANAIAKGYIESSLERKSDSSTYAKKYLEERLEELRDKLEESEQELVKYAQAEEIVAGESGLLDEQSLASLTTALVQAREARVEAQARWEQAQSDTGVIGFAVSSSEGAATYIRSLQQKRSELLTEYQDKLRIYKPGYPLMQQLKQQLDEIERQIAQELGEIRAAIRAQYDAAVAQEKLTEELLAQTKAEALDVQNRSIQYTIFKREVDTNRQLYDALLQRYKEVGVAAGAQTNNVSIIDAAESAGLVAPIMRQNLLLALVVGGVLGVLLALLLDYLDDTLKTPQDVESKLRLAHLGMVPRLAKSISMVEAEKDLRSSFSEAYRSLRTALQFSTESGIPNVLLVTSSMPNEGKSTTARVLAQNIAQLGKRVLLIDADLRNPSVHRTLGLDNGKGLSTCLSGAAKPAECIQKSDSAGISIMPSGPLPPNPAELLSGPRMLSLVTQASERFDHVILDAPPVLGLADGPILASISKGTLFVVEAGKTRVNVAQSAVKRLLGARARVLGVVLSKFDVKHASYGYGYGYGGTAYLGTEYYGYGQEKPPRRLGRS